MRTLTVGLAVLAVVIGLLLMRALVGALAFALKLGFVLAVVAGAAYAAYELYTGWTRPG